MELIFMFIVLCAFIIYFFPSILASSRNHRNGSAIFLTNLLFGWTFLGWAIAIIWAFTDNTID